MARYIDADKLWNDRPQIPEGKSMDYGAGFSECMWGFSRNIRKQIDTESADVVPKSEVEKWFRECEELQGRLIELEKEVAREIFEEIERTFKALLMGDITDIEKILAELKKKYTESEGKG